MLCRRYDVEARKREVDSASPRNGSPVRTSASGASVSDRLLSVQQDATGQTALDPIQPPSVDIPPDPPHSSMTILHTQDDDPVAAFDAPYLIFLDEDS